VSASGSEGAGMRSGGGGSGGGARDGAGGSGGVGAGGGGTRVGTGRRLRVLVVNGPNLNLLGTREPAIYGRETLDEINEALRARAADLGVDVAFFQSNHEGALIDRLQRRDFDASIVNAGGLTHTSVSLRDALLGIERPFVEVHLSDPATREPFRRVNFLEDVALARFVGMKAVGYHRALEELARRWAAGEIAPRAIEDRALAAGARSIEAGAEAAGEPRDA
jgi:3-dehydroquinate dehydratase-2